MASISRGPQPMRDEIVRASVDRQCDQYVLSLSQSEADILRLASAHHNGDECDFFQPPARGSYDICYFVQFRPQAHSPGERWAIRIPLEPCLAFGGRRKLESEVATMQLIAQCTTIPTPKIHAFALGDDITPLSSYLILEYVDAEKLSHSRLKSFTFDQRICFYKSLADIYIQLRRLEFPSIGRLINGPQGFVVSHGTLSIDINLQELEGLQPFKIQSRFGDSQGSLTSATTYTAMLLEIAENAFMKGRGSVTAEDTGEESLYHLHIFRTFAEQWIDPSLDHGPFVLTHGELEPSSLLVDDDCEVVSVINWGWSRVAPAQFFNPPLWVIHPDATRLATKSIYNACLVSRFNRFNGIVQNKEMIKYGNELLSSQWKREGPNGGFLVANALTNWTEIDWFASRFINSQCYGGTDDLRERIRDFMAAEPERAKLVERKGREGRVYQHEVQVVRNGGLPGEQGHGTKLARRQYSMAHIAMSLWRSLTLLPAQPVSVLTVPCAVVIIGGTYLLQRHVLRLFSRSGSSSMGPALRMFWEIKQVHSLAP